MFRILIATVAVLSFSTALRAQTTPTEWESAPAKSNQLLVSSEGYTYEGLLALGHGQYMAGNYAGAITQYEKARNLIMERPAAHYFIACAQAKQGLWAEATASLRTSATVAGTANPDAAAKALYMMAIVLEQSGDWNKAKFAWAEYQNSPGAQYSNFRAFAEQRVAAIEALAKRQTNCQIVKDRIAGAE